LLLSCQLCFSHVSFASLMSALLLSCQLCFSHVSFASLMSALLLSCQLCFAEALPGWAIVLGQGWAITLVRGPRREDCIERRADLLIGIDENRRNLCSN